MNIIRRLRDANLKNASPIGTAILDAMIAESERADSHLQDQAPDIVPAPFRISQKED